MCVYNMRVAPGTHPSVGSYLWMECSHHQEFQLPFGNLRLSRLFCLYFNFQNTKWEASKKLFYLGQKAQIRVGEVSLAHTHVSPSVCWSYF